MNPSEATLSTDNPERAQYFADLTAWIVEMTGLRTPPRPTSSTWRRWVKGEVSVSIDGLGDILDSCLEKSPLPDERRKAMKDNWLARWLDLGAGSSVVVHSHQGGPRAEPVERELSVSGIVASADGKTIRTDGPLALRLGDAGVNRERFGTKAAVMSEIVRRGLARVPEGWCLAADHVGRSRPEVIRAVDAIWNDIGASDSPLIVRSSASVEDKPDALFAGRFHSQPNVRERGVLHGALGTVVAAEDGVAVRDYVKNRDLPTTPVNMAVVIQKQVPAKFAGTAMTRPEGHPEFDLYVELRDGPSGPLLAGDELPSAYGLRSHQSGVAQQHLSGPVHESRVVTRFLPLVLDAAMSLADAFGTEQQVEWVWDGTDLWIVQARRWAPPPLADASDPPARIDVAGRKPGEVPVLRSLPNSKDWGLKGAAAHFFRNDEYFRSPPHTGARNCNLVLPFDDDEAIRREFAERVEGPDGTTIRFSYRAEVGVPRRFVPAGAGVLSTFLKMRKEHPEWMGIVSDYLYIQSSFEAYVARDSLLVEHVPGNWETGTQLPPDIFIFTADYAEVYLVTTDRLARFEAPGDPASQGRDGTSHNSYFQSVPPLTLEEAAEWARRFIDDFKHMSGTLRTDFPLNVHFISDPEGNFYYLNIRPTREVDISSYADAAAPPYKPTMMFRVQSAADVNNWNRSAKIMVDSAADRGDEERIAAVARALRAAGATTVYCRFGILSHPAIVLREFGLDVRPVNEAHKVYPLEGLSW